MTRKMCGLTVTCVAPIHDKTGAFAGVVCMDLLVNDLNDNITDINMGESSYVILLDQYGNVIAQIYETIEKNTVQVQQDMKDRIFHVNMVFVGNLILMCAAVLIGARLFAKRLTKPIIRMKEVVQNIDEGSVDLRVEVESRDEIGDLAEAFNHLHDSLKKYIDELTKMTAEKERISAELDVATRIQADMLPSIFPAFPEREEFSLDASMNPVKEVGGDFYDFFMVDENHLALVMADVSGKGVPAALFMVIAKTLLKNAAQQGLTPKETLERANR